MYNYFKEKIPGISEEEFDDFIVEVLETYEKEQGNTKQIDNNSLNNVGGGMNFKSKTLSGGLAIMSMISPIVGATSVQQNVISSPPTAIIQNINKQDNLKSQKSNKFYKFTKWVKEHPAISAGVTLAVVVGSVFAVRQFANSGTSSKIQGGAYEDIKVNFEKVTADTNKKIDDINAELNDSEIKKAITSAMIDDFYKPYYIPYLEKISRRANNEIETLEKNNEEIKKLIETLGSSDDKQDPNTLIKKLSKENLDKLKNITSGWMNGRTDFEKKYTTIISDKVTDKYGNNRRWNIWPETNDITDNYLKSNNPDLFKLKTKLYNIYIKLLHVSVQ